MPRPLQVYPLVSFLGDERGMNQILVPEAYSPQDSVNVWCDKYGQVKRIPGAAKLHPTALQDSVIEPAFAQALFPYSSNVGGATTHLVAMMADYTSSWLWYGTAASDYATWTNLGLISSTNYLRPPDFAQYGTTLLMTFGSTVPVKTLKGTTLANAGLTQSPTPSSSASSGGANLNGHYKWKLVSMIGAERQQGSVASTVLQLTNEQGTLSWTADANTSVTGYEVYRTTGTGEFYYYVGTVEGRTTVAYTDNMADKVALTNRALQEQGDAPPEGARFVEVHKERAWYGGTTAYPNRLWYSDAGRPESVGALSYIDFQGEHGGSPLVGMSSDTSGALIVWTLEGAWTVSGTGALLDGIPDLYVKRLPVSVGTISHRTVLDVPEQAMYRDATGALHSTDRPTKAYLTPHGDIRLLANTTDVEISAGIRNSAEPPSDWTSEASHAVHDQERGLLLWWLNDQDSAQPCTRTVAWDYRHGAWFAWDAFPALASTVLRESTGQQRIVAGTGRAEFQAGTGPFVFEILKDGEALNMSGDVLEGRWASGTLYGRLGEDTQGREMSLPAPHLMKRWRWVELLMQTDATARVEFQLLRATEDADGTVTPYVTKPLVLSHATKQTTSQKVQLKASTGRFMHDQGARLVVADNDSEAYETVYTTPGTVSFTALFTGTAFVEAVGGGGGTITATNGSGAGGGGGAYANAEVALVEGDVVTVTVGAGGALSGTGTGGSGGSSSFGSHVIAAGGAGGTLTTGGAGGTFVGSTGTVKAAGGAGGASAGATGNPGGGGGAGASLWGTGAAGTSGAGGRLGGVGIAPGGTGGLGGVDNASGADGSSYGGGGGGKGGTFTTALSGAGASGYVRVQMLPAEWVLEGMVIAYNTLPGTKRQRGE